MPNKKIKALVLLSGGLDSSLAAWLVKNQGIKIKGLIFKSVFFGPESGIRAAKELEIPYQVIDISSKLIEIIKNPEHGFGGAVNPCIDCHTLMVKKAKELLKKENYHFVVTGEVLGQRPFSQNKEAMETIAKESGLEEKLVRPLSAKKLEPTFPEKKGWLEREKLLDISGRSRKKQIQLAKKIGLSYSQPAGGCMLTEKEFAKKVFDLIDHQPNFNTKDAKLLKIGRHFWQGERLIVIGKNEEENKKLEKLAQPEDKLLIPANFVGPSGLIRGRSIDNQLIENTKELVLNYTPPRKQEVDKQPLLFFGSSQESVIVLKKLLEAKIPVAGIVTKTDQECGRGQKITPCPLADFAKKENLITFKLEKLTFKTYRQVTERLKFQPKWGVVAVYGKIIPQSWLNQFNIIVNLHPSLLPKWRGAAPTIRAIEAGKETTGWTIFKLVNEMDAGPIISQKKAAIKPQENAGQLTTRLFRSSAKELIRLFRNLYQANEPKFWLVEPQNEAESTFAEKIDKKEAKINWDNPPQKIVNKIRAFNPWPGAYTPIKIKGNKKRLKIWQAHVEENIVVPDIVHLAGKCRCSWKQFSKNYNINLENLKKT